MPAPTTSPEIADRVRRMNGHLPLRGLVITLLFTFSVWPQSVSSNGPASTDDAVRALSASNPKIRWDRASAVRGDIACDKQGDIALLGHADKRLFLGFFRAQTRKTQILEFRVGGNFQDGVCDMPAKLEIEPTAEPDAAVPGFRKSDSCKGLTIADNDCDPIHLFWNHDTHQLNWWRN